MKIKYKLILLFILFTGIILTPFFSFLIQKLESETLNYTINQSKTNSKIFAKSVLNILMMNGGDIQSSSVDIKDMASMLEPLKDGGLVYADAILLSSDPDKNGTIMASIKDNDSSGIFNYTRSKVTSDEIQKMLYINSSYREFTLDETYIEFTATGNLPNQPPFCIARMIISKSKALAHITALKLYINIALIILMLTVIICAVITGGYISRPIIKLTDSAKEIESGNYNHKVDITQRDEVGALASTFNKMAAMINLKITELQQANEDLTKMDKLKDEFLANTSHELKTPIHGIIGLTESLLDGACGDSDSSSKQLLAMILQSSRRLSKLVNDIIDYSKLKNRDIKLKKASVDLGSMSETILAMIRPFTSGKNITLINDIKPGKYFVNADEERLQQILLNLTGNAVKFTEKGQIIISASALPSGECSVDIADTGIGIPLEKQNMIFESFVQSDGSTTRKYGGTGLGLTITKDLVELHGGTINFTSVPGEGSVFSFTMPLAETSLTTADISPVDRYAGLYTKMDLITDLDTDSTSGARVMIVDDDIINLQLLLNQLKKEGYSVTSFTGGEEALASIESGETYDIILLDVMMPVISGYEVCRKIREKFSPHELPIVMLTAKNTSQDIITGISMGANDYITKPFDREVLLTRVKSYISLKKAVDEQNKFIAVKQELEIAKKIQLAILPHTLPEMQGLSIDARYEPMTEIGGDFYDFLRLDNKRIGVLIADVTGHGVPAALISSMVKIAYYMSADSLADPSALLEKMNASLIDHIYGRFITAFYAYIDLNEMKMTFSNAAHWPMYLHNKENGNLRELSVKGRLIGLNRDEKFKNVTIDIKKGERLVFFTDGIVEERNSEGELLDEENLERIIKENPSLSPEQLLDAIFSSIYRWSGRYRQSGLEDDATMLVIDFE
jgi:two-component system sensor histidine kinase ChiS